MSHNSNLPADVLGDAVSECERWAEKWGEPVEYKVHDDSLTSEENPNGTQRPMTQGEITAGRRYNKREAKRVAFESERQRREGIAAAREERKKREQEKLAKQKANEKRMREAAFKAQQASKRAQQASKNFTEAVNKMAASFNK